MRYPLYISVEGCPKLTQNYTIFIITGVCCLFCCLFVCSLLLFLFGFLAS